jgi:hypothetical protein
LDTTGYSQGYFESTSVAASVDESRRFRSLSDLSMKICQLTEGCLAEFPTSQKPTSSAPRNACPVLLSGMVISKRRLDTNTMIHQILMAAFGDTPPSPPVGFQRLFGLLWKEPGPQS